MRGRSSKQGNCKGERMEIDNKLDKLKEEPQLSGAYIRSLVKQLTSSRTKDPMNPKDHQDSSPVLDGDDKFPAQNQNLTKISETQQPQPPQQHKKQVRRRLHTSRPYQERLLNMAEARREIVTALKLHRATMKQANEHRQPPPPQTQSLQPSPQPEQEMKSKSRRNPRIYASTTTTTTNFSNYLDNLSYQSFPYQPPQNSYSWPISAAPPLPIPENFNLTLPNQTLGLNLNLQDFNNLDASFFQNNYNPSINYSPSSPSTSSSPPLSVTTDETPYLEISQAPLVTDSSLINERDLGLHQAMDEEEMAEIRSLGEQHQIEWNDTLNLVSSAWWFKFLKTMEIGPEVKAEEDDFHLFDQVMEFPAWLNANDSCLQQLDHHQYSSDYFQDPALPCMDIGEIEGMDGEWLA